MCQCFITYNLFLSPAAFFFFLKSSTKSLISLSGFLSEENLNVYLKSLFRPQEYAELISDNTPLSITNGMWKTEILFQVNRKPNWRGKWNREVSKISGISKEIISINSAVKIVLGVLALVGVYGLFLFKEKHKTKPKNYTHLKLCHAIVLVFIAHRTRDYTRTDQNLVQALRSLLFTPPHWYYTLAIMIVCRITLSKAQMLEFLGFNWTTNTL